MHQVQDYVLERGSLAAYIEQLLVPMFRPSWTACYLRQKQELCGFFLLTMT